MATPTQIKRRGRLSLILGTVVAALTLVAVAYADEVINTLDNTIDPTAEVMNLTAGGATGSTKLYVKNQNAGDGDTNNACNLAGAASVTVTAVNTNPGVATVSPSSVTLTECGDPTTGTQTITVTPLTSGSTSISWTVTSFNGSGTFDTAPANFTVNVVSNNRAPSANAGGPYTVAEGSTVQVSGSGTDPDGDTLSYSWDLDNNGTFETLGQTATFSAVGRDGPDSQTVVFRVCDDGTPELCATDGVTVGITNANPTITSVTNSGPINEGSAATISVSATDPAGAADPLSYGYDCDNNGSYESSTNSCSFADNGTFTVGVRVSDDDGGSVTSSTAVVVNNVAPIVTAGFASAAVGCGTSNALLNISFSDVGVNDANWAVVINWGDGSSNTSYDASTQGVQAAQGHTYATAGNYNATVTVTDKDGGVGSDGTNALTVNYNLSALLQPINNTGHGESPSLFKYGSTVPVKVEITDCDGSHPSSLDVRVTAAKVSGNPPVAGTDETAVANQPDSGNAMRFSDPLYVFNWSTKSITDSSSTVRITVKITQTNQTVSADIGLKAK